MSSAKKSFTALLEPDGTALRWVIARLPFDIAKTWPNLVRRRVRGQIGEYAFRTTLFPGPRGQGLVLMVNKKMLAAAGARVGDRIRIVLEPDLEEREARLPAELLKEIKGDRRLKNWIEKLSPSARREIDHWISEPKSVESRSKRAVKMAERCYQAMEGETDPPPILKAAFRRQPLAEKGWHALTPAQRRNHLLGIFYYETVEARERRTAKAIEEALKAARKLNQQD